MQSCLRLKEGEAAPRYSMGRESILCDVSGMALFSHIPFSRYPTGEL